MKKPFTIQEWLKDKTQKVIDNEGNFCMIVRIDFQDVDRGTVIHCKKSDREYYYPLVENDLFLLDSLSVDAPEGLDEAAYKYSFESRPSVYGQVDVIDAFKAGAEWAFGQGYSVEDRVRDLPMKYLPLWCEKAEPNDKVIVQIRKK